MEAGLLNLVAYKGRDFTSGMTSLDASEKPHNFTGYAAIFRVLDKAGNTLVERTTEDGGVTLGGPLGTIVLTMTQADTANLPTRPNYTFDLIDTFGKKFLYLHGDIYVSDR